jgi:pimeloyl-ACP methyl ester carboxylesterase
MIVSTLDAPNRHNAPVSADAGVREPAAEHSGDPERHDVPEGGRSGFVRVADRQVHYLEWGRRDAAPILCLHGGGQTAYMFESLGGALRDSHFLLAPDLPNHGDSDSVPYSTESTRHVIAESLPGLLAEFGVRRTAVVGASLGGMTAITLAAARPELISAIVLVDVGHRLEDAGVRRIIDFMTKHESFGSLEEAAAAIAEYVPRRSAARTSNLSRNLRRRSDGRWVWKHGFGRMRPGEGVSMPGHDDWRGVLEGLDDDARKVEVPTLVIRGGESDVLTDEGAQDVAALIKQARVVVVPDAGHLTAGDNPDGTVAQIRSFLAGIPW